MQRALTTSSREDCACALSLTLTLCHLRTRATRCGTYLLLILGLTMPVIATAWQLLDPGSTSPALRGNISTNAALPSGFVPLVFRPVPRSEQSQSVQSARWSLNSGLTDLPGALHWHAQNTMPWLVGLTLTLTDAQGNRLESLISLPPGPPQTIVIPTQATSPLAWGMRAAPPQLFEIENERILVASTVSGHLASPPVAAEVSMPAPVSPQTLLFGKLFVRSDRNDLRRLYTELIDCFGQFSRGVWPEKKHGPCAGSITKASRRHDKPANQAHKALPDTVNLDRFGGLILNEWPASTLATGAFRAYEIPPGASESGGKKLGRWILLTPQGNPFFSLGVNAIQLSNSETFVEGREFMFNDLPDKHSPLSRFYGRRDSTDVLPADAGAQRGRQFGSGRSFDFYRANLYRRDGENYAAKWQQRTEHRLKQWSFNTAAAWSDENFTQHTSIPYTAIIHIAGPFQRLSDGHDWWQGIADPFDPAFQTALDETFERLIPAHRDNAHLLGYFVDNELAWGNGASSDPNSRYGPVMSALAMDAAHPHAYAKRAFIKHLRSRYRRIEKLANAWEIPIDSWQALQRPLWADRTHFSAEQQASSALKADLSSLLTLHANEYFERVSQTLDNYDAKHLYLGSRFASRTPESVAACARHCDVVSFNLYVPDIDSGFEAEAFARHNKPALLTEFHFGSPDRGPFWAGVMSVAREQDRAPAYQRMINSVVANRQFVGAHWFQYLDQPATGRWLDGENGHLGLVSITDTPWQDFTSAVAQTNRAALQSISMQVRQGKR